jgi:hypothetical protein
MAKKSHALIPSEREKECPHNHAAYSGRVPNTGPIVCSMCGSYLPPDFFDRKGNSDAAH